MTPTNTDTPAVAWRSVPVEATEAMIEAATGSKNPVLNTERWDDPSVDVREIWQEMWAAAPAPDVRERVVEAVHAWLREDTSLVVKMNITPEARDKLVNRLLNPTEQINQEKG